MGYTSVKTYRNFGDPSFATLGEGIFGADMDAFTWVYMPDGAIDVFKGNVRLPSRRYVGIVTNAGVIGEDAVVAFAGEITITTGGLSPGQVYYADPTVLGGMTKVRPVGDYQIVGIAITEWRFVIAIQNYFSVSDNLLYFNSDQDAFDAGQLLYKTGTRHESMPYGIIKEVHPDIS